SQRKEVVLQNRREGDNARPGTTYAVVHYVIIRRVRRTHRVKCPIRFGGVQAKSCFPEGGGRLGIMTLFVIHRESPKLGLRVGQNVLYRGELQDVARVARTEHQTLATIDNRASQAERDRGHPIFVFHWRHWIEVVRSNHPRKIWIKALTMPRPNYLL